MAQGGSMGELIWWDSFQVWLISCNLRSPNQIVLTPGSPLTRSAVRLSSPSKPELTAEAWEKPKGHLFYLKTPQEKQSFWPLLDRKRAEIISRRLERIAEDNSIYNSFNTNYLVSTTQDEQKSRLDIEIPYLLITLKKDERIAVAKDDNSYDWEKPTYLMDDNQKTGEQTILNDNLSSG